VVLDVHVFGTVFAPQCDTFGWKASIFGCIEWPASGSVELHMKISAGL